MGPMRIVIEGFDLPGRTFCAPEGSPLMNVHVGVRIKASDELGSPRTVRRVLGVPSSTGG